MIAGCRRQITRMAAIRGSDILADISAEFDL